MPTTKFVTVKEINAVLAFIPEWIWIREEHYWCNRCKDGQQFFNGNAKESIKYLLEFCATHRLCETPDEVRHLMEYTKHRENCAFWQHWKQGCTDEEYEAAAEHCNCGLVTAEKEALGIWR